MKTIFNILKIFLILLIALLLTLSAVSFFMQDKVAVIIMEKINEKISTKLEVASFKLSFVRKFPKATLELNNVIVHSSTGFDVTLFKGIDTDTLLSASKVSVDFSIYDIINGKYNIDRIGVKKGKINLLADALGKVNYNISVKSNQKNSNSTSINLDKIYLSDINVAYRNLSKELVLKGYINDGWLKSRISWKEIDFAAKSDIDVSFFKLYSFIIDKKVSTAIDLNMQSTESGIEFKKGSLDIAEFEFDITGVISSDNNLNIALSGDKIDLSMIKWFLPQKYLNVLADYNVTGILKTEGKIKGVVSSVKNPAIDVSFILNNGNVAYNPSALAINNLSFSGNFSNGSGRKSETSSLIFRDVKAQFGSSQYTGSLALSNFNKLSASLSLNGKVIASELKEFFNLKKITSITGSIDLDLNLSGEVPSFEKFSLPDILSMNPKANMQFDSFSLAINNDKTVVDNINGYVHFSDTIEAKKLQFKYREQLYKTDGTLINLPGWLLGKPVVLKVSANIFCDKCLPGMFISEKTLPASPQQKPVAFMMPNDVILDLNFAADSFLFKTFTAENVRASINYKSGLLNFKTVSLSSLEGALSGNGYLVQNANKSFIAKGDFNIDKINIYKAFVTFNNFGQKFITAENLEGLLTGTLSVLIPMDSLFKSNIRTISAEGKYKIENGSLIDFEPVKSLSSFVEISELENIRFEKLENDFFINNNIFYIPQMEVKSSVADLSVNGKQNFSNGYEYHVKMLLSEILSKKYIKPKPNTTEFGAVADDGLGRTTVLLKIYDKDNKTKVVYDIKAAGNKVKNDIKNEKQTLKTILNQEYGWYKNDTTISTKPETGSKKFKISWDGSNADQKEADPIVEEPKKKENSFLNRLKLK